MKKYFLALGAILVALSFSSWAGALTVSTENYYGGTIVGYPNYVSDIHTDVIGGTDFSVDSLTASKDANGLITVVLKGTYFLSDYATGTSKYGNPGDLYISSTGWVVNNPANNADTDKFELSEGWNYVVKFSRASGTNNTSLNSLSGAYTPTGSESHWGGYRIDQAYQGGYGTMISAATSTLDSNQGTLTFIFNSMGLDPNAIGYHWTMACGNDVVEGGGKPVPEPGTLILLGLGVLGLGMARLRK